jgi:hypothetical protein
MVDVPALRVNPVATFTSQLTAIVAAGALTVIAELPRVSVLVLELFEKKETHEQV